MEPENLHELFQKKKLISHLICPYSSGNPPSASADNPLAEISGVMGYALGIQ